MLTNYIKVTLRNLYREKRYAIINIFGLALAIACCLILGLWLRSEFTYDRHNTKYKQLFRLIDTNDLGSMPSAPAAMGPSLSKDYPEIKGYVRFGDVDSEGEPLVRYGAKVFKWESILYADNSVFDLFTHDIIYGDPKTALINPGSVAVSESFAGKYFGNANPIGENIIFNDKTYKVMLVFADLPDNTSLKYDMLISYREKELADGESNLDWGTLCATYLLMPEGYKAQDFKSISETIYSHYLAGKNRSPLPERHKYWLQPMSDIHFNSDVLLNEGAADMFFIYGFTAVAVFILLVACINHMNLATARASKRAKEVGMRKILGSSMLGLRLQFLSEAVFFSLIALFIGLVLTEIALNLTPVNQLLNKHLTLNFSRDPDLILWLLAFGLIVVLMAGSFPAFYLSSIPAMSVLKSGPRFGKRGMRFRQLLVLIQFIIAVSVIACTLIMALQMRYVSQKPLGFEKENRVVITLQGDVLIKQIPTLKTELLKNGNILGLTHSDDIIGRSIGIWAGPEGDVIKNFSVDEDFIKEMGLQIVSGRDFLKTLKTDIESSIIVNEALVKAKGWDEPIGQQLMHIKVIGVVKDFNFVSLHSPIEPLGITLLNDSGTIPYSISRQLIVHISKKNVSDTLKFLERKFAELDPTHPFQYKFLDEYLDNNYLSDRTLMKLVGIFGGLCILISCMGIFGLSAFTTEQRTKEIGVRKVLGATTWQIIIMLSRNILLLVLGGSIIASVVAYYAMDEWLTSFAYRTGINPLVFLVSAIVAAGVAFITVAFQAYKTARANPVEALRYE